MKNHPNHNKTINGFAQILVTLRNRYFFALDLLAFVLTPVLAVWLRTDGADDLSGLVYVAHYVNSLALYALVATLLRWAVFIPFGLYSRNWHYASVDELGQIAAAVTMSTILVALAFFGILKPFGLLAPIFRARFLSLMASWSCWR